MSDQVPPRHEPVGSAAQEAARLLAALSGWAQGQLADVNGHLATGAPECSYCPVCRTVHAVREVSPEVREHLATAAASLMQAVAGMLTAAASSHPRAADRAPTVEKIDLDTLGAEWPDA